METLTPEATETILAALHKLSTAMDEQTQSLLEKLSNPCAPQENFTLSGLAMQYNKLSSNKITRLPGCLSKWLQDPKPIPLRFQHRKHLVAGQANTFTDTERGIMINGTLDDSPVGRDCQRLIKAGVIDSLSSGIRYNAAIYQRDPDSGILVLPEIEILDEVSLVLMPAASGTLLSTAKKETRETIAEHYRQRLKNFWMVKDHLESKEIHDCVLEEIREYNQYKGHYIKFD